MPGIEIDAALRIREVNREIKQLNRDIRAARIAAFSIPTALDTAGFKREITRLRREAISNSVVVPLRAKLDIPDDLAIALKFDTVLSKEIDLASQNLTKNITGAISEGFKQAQSGNIFSGLFKLSTSLIGGLFSGLTSLISGAIIGLTLPLGQKLGAGLSEGIESELRSSIGSFDLIGRQVGSSLVDEILSSLNTDARSLRSVFENFIPSLQIDVESAAGRYLTAQSDRVKATDASKQFQAEQKRLQSQQRLFRTKELALRDTANEIDALSLKIAEKIDAFESDAGLPKLLETYNKSVQKLNKQTDSLAKKLQIPSDVRSTQDNRAIELLNTQIRNTNRDIATAQANIKQIDDSVLTSFGTELNNLKKIQAGYKKAVAQFESELAVVDQANVTRQIRQQAQQGKIVDFGSVSQAEVLPDTPKTIAAFDELINLYNEVQKAEAEIKQKNFKARRIADKKEEFQLEVDLLRQQDRREKQLTSLINNINDVVLQASPAKFQELAKLIFEVSNIDPGEGLEKLPQLVLPGNQLLEQLLTSDTLAAYSTQLNSLVVDPNLFAGFQDEIELTNREIIEGVGLSIREIRKQITSDFGDRDLTQLTVADLPTSLLQATEEEIELIGEQIENIAKQAATSQGIDPDVARAIEQDALLFELRFTESISKRIGLLAEDFDIEKFTRGAAEELTVDKSQIESIFRTLAEASNVSFDAIADQVSTVVLPETERLQHLIASRASARFDALNNQILLRPAAFNELAAGGMNLSNVETEAIAHEFRHGLQTAFGQLSAEDLNAGKFGVELLKATKTEMKFLGDSIEKSVQSALKSGSDLSAETIRALEEDAYVFQLRAGKLVAQSLEPLTNPKAIPTQIAEPTKAADEVKHNLNKAVDAYQIIFEEVVKASNLGDELELLVDSIPTLKPVSPEQLAENPDIQGAYDRLFNAIFLRPEKFAQLDAGNIDFDIVSFLSHEIRHALEQMFGTISDADVRAGKVGVELLKATEDEFAEFSHGIMTSIKNAAAERKDVSKILEEDAYTFQLRFSEQIFNRVSTRLKEVQNSIDTEPEESDRSVTGINTAVEEIKENISNAQRIYELIFKKVAEASNFELYDFDELPALTPRQLPAGIKGQYSSENNLVNISPKALEDLDFNLISQEIVDIIVHEIRHSLQSALGTLDIGDQLAGQFGVDLIIPLENEVIQIIEQVNKSVLTTLERLKQQGVSQKALADLKPILEQTETDAYTFSLRFHKQIFDEIQQSLKPAVIDIGNINALSQEEIIKLFNSEQFSRDGLRELVKRIGISANVYGSATKAELAQVLANQTDIGKGDEIRSIANSLGDRIKNKKFQTGATPQLPQIDEQAYVARLQEALSNISEIISLIKSNPPQTIEALNQNLYRLAKEISRRNNEIIAVTNINDISSETAQVISGYKSQFQALGRDLINAISDNSKQTIEDGLNQLAKIEQEIKSVSFDQVENLVGVTAATQKVVNNITSQIQKVFEIDIPSLEENDIDRTSLKNAIAQYKDSIIAYRKQLEEKLLTGENVDFDIQAGEQLAKRGQALATTLKEQKGFSKEAKALEGVSQTLLNKTSGALTNDAVKASDEVINGILQGTNQKLVNVFALGQNLGFELLKGFKDKLGIQSPSDEFKNRIEDIADGAEIGADNQQDRFESIGEDLADSLTSSFDDAVKEASESIEDIDVSNIDFWDDEQLEQANEAFQNITDQIEDISSNPVSIEIDDPWEDVTPIEDVFNGDIGLEQQAETTFSFFDRIKLGIEEAKNAFTDLFSLPSDNQDTEDLFQNAVEQANEAIANIEANLERVDQAVAESEAQIIESNESTAASIANLGGDTETIFTKIKRLIKIAVKDFGNLEGITKKVGKAFKFLIAGVIAVKGIEIAQEKFAEFTETLQETILKFDEIQTAINFVNKNDFQKTKNQIKFLREEADRLKAPFLEAAEGFKKLAAASRETDIENITEDIYSTVLQAGRVLQLDKENVAGVFKALNDIINKGNLQAEELRGQLGDRLSGSFQIATRAYGIEREQFNKLLETGQISSTEFIPKFIKQLKLETQGGVKGAVDSLSASIVNFENKIVDLQLTIGEALGIAENQSKTLNLAVVGLDALSLLIVGVSKSFPLLKLAIKGVIGIGLIKFLTMANKQFASLTKSIKAAVFEFNSGATSSMKFKRTLVQLRKIGRTLNAVFKGLVIVETISVAIDTFNRLNNGIEEAKEGLDSINESYQNFQKILSENQPENEFLLKDIVEENIKAIKENRNWYMKLTDAGKAFLLQEQQGLLISEKRRDSQDKFARKLLGDTWSQTQIRQASNRLTQSIIQAQGNLNNLNLDLGLTLQESETDDIRSAIVVIENTIEGLRLQTATTVDEQRRLNLAIAIQKDRAAALNEELERRFNLEKSLAQIALKRDQVNIKAINAEADAIAEIDQQTLESGDLARDVELLKLKATQERIKIQYGNEIKSFESFNEEITRRNKAKLVNEAKDLDEQRKQSLITEEAYQKAIAKLQEEYVGIDASTGAPKNLTEAELKKYLEMRDAVRDIRQEMIENSLAVAQSEVDTRLRIYDEYLEKIDQKSEEALQSVVDSEKQLLVQIQQLVNDDLINAEQAEDLKGDLTRARIKSELSEEKKKLSKLKRFRTDEKEVREQVDNDIRESKHKILDLTLQLLEEEKAATEKTIAAIAQSRDNVFSALEQRLSRLQQLQQSEAQLINDRASAEEKLADLQLAKLRQALELRQEINSGDLNNSQRRTALRQLYSLGVEGRTTELSLLSKIEDKEKAIAETKLQNLLKQQELKQQEFNLEVQQLELTTKKANLEAKRQQRDAQSELIAAEQAVINAGSQEEYDRANELYNLAQLSVQIADAEAIARQQELDNLDSVIAKKKEILEFNQAIARAELKGTNADAEFALERERNAARESRQRARAASGQNVDLSRYLSRQEKLDQEVTKIRETVESKGKEFTAEDEQQFRARKIREFNRLDSAQAAQVRNSLLGSSSFTIEAPPEILKAISTGKPITVPAIQPFRTTSPLQLTTIPSFQGSLGDNQQILKVLSEIKDKQPVVVNAQFDNQFVNKYEDKQQDEILRQLRSEQVEMLNNAVNLARTNF